MAVLTPAQQTAYYASEGSKATPLSPTAWLAAQNGGSAPSASAPVATLGPTALGPVQQAPQPITYNVDAANSPSTLYTMPNAASMPDWKTTLASLPTSSAIAAEQSPEQIAAATEQKSLQQKILDSLSGFGAKMGLLDQNTGLSDTKSQLDEIYGQINGLQTEAQAIPTQIQADSEGRGRTDAGVAPIEADLTRTNALKALTLSARASVLQGKLGAAQQQMDRLQQVQQSELDYLKQALDFNASTMDEANQKQATQIQIKLKERQDALDKQTASSNQVMQMLVQAKAAGAPDTLIAQAHALDPLGAESLLVPYLKAKSDLLTVSKGSTVIDPTTGKVVYQAPDTTKTTPTIIQSGSIVATAEDLAQGATALKASASQGAEADGKYADPNLYLQMYQHWVNSGGKAADFFKNYPFETYINPANTWLTQSISAFNQSHSSGGSGGDQNP